MRFHFTLITKRKPSRCYSEQKSLQKTFLLLLLVSIASQEYRRIYNDFSFCKFLKNWHFLIYFYNNFSTLSFFNFFFFPLKYHLKSKEKCFLQCLFSLQIAFLLLFFFRLPRFTNIFSSERNRKENYPRKKNWSSHWRTVQRRKNQSLSIISILWYAGIFHFISDFARYKSKCLCIQKICLS